ncbi:MULTISPECIES: serine hydrolase [Novosphingobium]|uniref:Beta-lactamase n=1 Tax=Novosphingobium pentaromativorans TaxID=205844 RepID=A0A2W5NKT4_9SPHN|nr:MULTISPECIES: serine hydrolase [Novosphingobium]PZQ52879.1 MAG: serine hydrolase [Novosphingobium pentaromativorans]GFE73111.1 beta-lactamase [Novosphingobium sp. TCA1]
MIGADELIARCRKGTRRFLNAAGLLAGGVALAAVTALPAQAQVRTQVRAQAGAIGDVQDSFDSVFGTEQRAPRTYSSDFGRQLATVAEASRGRIGVAAMDLATGRMVDVLGNQRFPMASTSKIAIAATFLEGVDKGKWTLSSEFPLMVPVPSAPFSSAVAPVRAGTYMSARQLIELMITRSNNYATDALLKVVGGPSAVNAWVRRTGIDEWHIDRDIATLVRDDGAIDPAKVVDKRDSATPIAVVELLAGIYNGKWMSKQGRDVLLGAMSRTVTGKRRIRAGLPAEVVVSHKTGSLNNTSSDIGIIETPDGHAYAVAIYVTGQGTRPNREARIASIARTIYDGYLAEGSSYRTAAR